MIKIFEKLYKKFTENEIILKRIILNGEYGSKYYFEPYSHDIYTFEDISDCVNINNLKQNVIIEDDIVYLIDNNQYCSISIFFSRMIGNRYKIYKENKLVHFMTITNVLYEYEYRYHGSIYNHADEIELYYPAVINNSVKAALDSPMILFGALNLTYNIYQSRQEYLRITPQTIGYKAYVENYNKSVSVYHKDIIGIKRLSTI